MAEYLEKITDLSQVTDKLYHISIARVTSSISTLTTNPVVLTNIQGNIKSLYSLRVVIVEIAKRYTFHPVGENLFIWFPENVIIQLLPYWIY